MVGEKGGERVVEKAPAAAGILLHIVIAIPSASVRFGAIMLRV